MSEYNTEFFVATTGEDQQNYFFGEDKTNLSAFWGQELSLPQGSYRIIDGQLCQIVSGLSTEDVRKRLLLSQTDS